MSLLLTDIESLLPFASPWETLGGHDELATVIFLRGALLGNFGFIETQLNELAIRSSYLSDYYELHPKFPNRLNERLDYLCKAFTIDGPLKVKEKAGIELVERFRSKQNDRNKWAHGALNVLPGSVGNRWDGAWITLTNYNPAKNVFKMTTDRLTHQQITELVKEVRALALVSNEIHCTVTQTLPEH